jgi:hypothetical protein
MFALRWLSACLLMQVLPAGPIETARGTVTVSGEVTATAGAKDDTAFFNYTDYEHNALRMFRLSLSAMWRPLAALRRPDRDPVRGSPARDSLRALRPRPPEGEPAFRHPGRPIPPVFGTFARRSYGADNPLIGFPLAYQYLTSMRPRRRAGQRRRPAAHARPRLARQLSGRHARAGARRPGRERPTAGTRASRRATPPSGSRPPSR